MSIRRRACLCLALALAMKVVSPTTAIAEHVSGGDAWSVAYTAGGTMTDTYSLREFADQVSGLQPGDDITFTVTLLHQNDAAADWYVSNDVIKSLEEGEAQGSAYEYELTYAGPEGNHTLYHSSAVGGDDSAGLVDATNALEGFVALGRLRKGQSAKVTVRVALDGETEGNAYFDTLARLKLQFAVEPEPSPAGTTTRRRLVQTGDEQRLLPLYVVMVVSGGALLALVARSAYMRRSTGGEGVQ